MDDDELGRGAITAIECRNCTAVGPITTGGAAIAVRGWNWRGDDPKYLSKDRRQVGQGWGTPAGVCGEIVTDVLRCPFCSFSELRVLNFSDPDGVDPTSE